MSREKEYQGEKFRFIRNTEPINRGGNGAIYDIKFVGEESPQEYPVVAKFFNYTGSNRPERYTRFKNEIDSMYKLNGIKGIMPIIDKYCPEDISEEPDSAWYLMPKAEPYKVNRRFKQYDKISDMIEIGEIIKCIHSKGLAHRDIKPENILVLYDKLILSDFGLCWNCEEAGVTKVNERLGPYKIMPPEFESVRPDFGFDYRRSDVYLFAKVVWMTLKEDNIGFRGQYQRGDAQIYLNKENYKVKTLEPIHEMLEKATCEVPENRIDINECINYLQLQKNILRQEESLSDELMNQMIYTENSKKIIASNKAEKLVYEDTSIIFSMIKDIYSVSDIFVENPIQRIPKRKIHITFFSEIGENKCRFQDYINGNKIKEYIFAVKNMTYSEENESIILELEDIPDEDLNNEDYKEYAELQHGIDSLYPKVYLDKNEIITIEKTICR